MPIQHTTQVWRPGYIVQVGFLKLLIVRHIPVEGEPDVYELRSLDGTKRYEFQPHLGLTRIA